MRRLATRTLVLAMVFALALPAVLAVNPADSPTRPLTDDCVTVTGIVAEENGAPIRGITVVALPAASNTVLTLLAYDGDETTADGTYTLKLTPGQWRIVATDQSGTYSSVQAARTFTCGDTDLDFELSPAVAAGNSARGHLEITLLEDMDAVAGTESDRIPMAGVPVTIFTKCALVSSVLLTQGYVASGVTDDQGLLLLKLPTGNFCIKVDMGSDYIDNGMGSNTNGDYVKDNFATVASGEVATEGLTFTKKTRTATIRVEDYDVPGMDVANAQLVLNHPRYCPDGDTPTIVGPRYSCTAVTGEDGRVSVTMPIDSDTAYGFTGTHPKFFSREGSCSYSDSPRSRQNGDTPAQQNALPCSLSLTHVSRVISGRVVNETGVGISNATVEFRGIIGLDSGSVTTDSDGRFLTTRRSDDYTLRIDGGDAGQTTHCLTVAGPVDVAIGDISLKRDTTFLSGTVRDGNVSDQAPVAGTLIRLIDETANICHTYSTSTGEFGIELANETNYVLKIGNDLSAAFDFKTLTTSVEFQDVDGNQTVGDAHDIGDVLLERRDGRLSIQVNQDVGGSVSGAHVTCTSVTTGATRSGITGDTGSLTLEVPFGGGYRCSATDPEGNLADAPLSSAVSVTKGGTTSVPNLVMERLFWIFDGTLTNLLSRDPEAPTSTGEPVADVSVTITNRNCAIAGGTGCTGTTTTDADGGYTLRIPYFVTAEDARVNVLQMSYTHGEYEPLLLVGLIGADVPAVARAKADQELVPAEGKALETVDSDKDGVPDSVEPQICEVELSSLPEDGECTSDRQDYHPPTEGS